MERSAPELTWDFSCPDWEERLRNGDSLIPALPLDEQIVAKAIGIFDHLRLPDVTGNPTMREAAGDWWRDVNAAIFGSIDDEGFRHVREALVLVPKKNSKTTNAAATGITALLMDETPRQRYSLYGPTQEISDRGFAQAVGMIQADREGFLQQRFHVRAHLKTIVDRKTESTLKVSTFDEKVATGGIEKGVIIDELHILGKAQAASRVLGQIRGGMLPRKDAFMLMITTQSDTPPAGVFRQELMLARAIRDGRVKGAGARLLPVLYEFPEAMQTSEDRAWANPDNWPMVLPNMGRSIEVRTLSADWEAAKEKGEEEIRRWASQHLNVEIGLALHADRWRGADYWEGATDPELVSLEALLARSDVAVVGIDGGGLDDLLGLAVLGRDRKTRDWLLWSRAWAHQDVLDRRKDIASTLMDFAADGDLIICDDPTQDVTDVADIVEQVKDAGLLPEVAGVGVDAAGIAAIVEELAARGIGDQCVVAVQQGYKLNGAILGAERKLYDGTLWHAGQKLMAWCVGNAKVEMRGSAVLVTKQVAGRAKIDPLAALFNAVMLMARNPEGVGESVYETRGVLVF